MSHIDGDAAAVALALIGICWYCGCGIGRMESYSQGESDKLKKWQYIVSVALLSPLFLRLLIAVILN